MKALIAAGGRATRLRPITHTRNKHLIPIGGRPMIVYALEKLRAAGITEVYVNVNPGDTEMRKLLGDGSQWGMNVTVIEQTGGPQGVAHILRGAKPYLQGEPFIFYLGDNIILGDIKRFCDKFAAAKCNALLAIAKVPDPQRFGVPEFRDGKIIRVIEKPAHPPSEYAVTGIYVYDDHVFEAAENIQPSARGEYEISDVHTWLIDHGYNVAHEEVTGWWKDTGKPEDLLHGNQLVLSEMRLEDATSAGWVGPEAIIQGRVRIGAGTRLEGKTLIRGPVTIGENCVIDDSYVGPYTSIGNGVKILKTEIEHSIVLDSVELASAGRLVDSLLGEHARVAGARTGSFTGHKMIISDHSQVEI